MIAALFVDPRGIYSTFDGVDCWGPERDARTYAGPWPVVAHPPCTRWCRLAGLVEARWGHKKGEDGGCFASALESVRRYGGVLEHPAYSDAWPAFDLPVPLRGGWQAGLCGGWSCHVEQVVYGHPARKATWLYAFGVDLPDLNWGTAEATARVSACVNRGDTHLRKIMKSEAAATPKAFAEVLIATARTAHGAA